jgi:uncharacterized membrane protein (UPF0127 family)
MDKTVLFAAGLFVAIAGTLLIAMGPGMETGRGEAQSDGLAQGIEPKPNAVEVCFPSTCIQAEVADTAEERSRGLMYREQLEEGEGMLFVFEEEAAHSFWMKNTLIALDIIWVGRNKKVVHVETTLPCTTEACQSYVPNTPALYVVEANAGFAEDNGIEVGDAVEFEG